ncbi:YwmB family TATA-box binding protein [Terrilactibacillus sp. S3-3]|nr:YwmB family TATA-box binding protein [Terrilactibacillus sp. S3-3]
MEQKVKVQIISILLILVLLMTAFAEARAAAKFSVQAADFKQVPVFAKVLEKHHAQVSLWSLYAREQFSKLNSPSDFYEHEQVEKHKQDLPEYSWGKVEKKEGQYQVSAAKKLKGLGAEEKISFFAYPEGRAYETYALYEIQGRTFDKSKWAGVEEQARLAMNKVFHGRVKIFSCVKANDSAKMKLGLSNEGNQLLKDFSADSIEKINEKTFVSISAYTTEWKHVISTGDKKMNLQVALRKDDGVTTITLGTPIITIEY